MHCAGQHKPYAEWHKPYVEWHKPCRYYRLFFRNLQAPPQIPATVFCGFPPVLTTTLPALLPMAYAADFPWVVFDNPHRSAVSVAGFRCCFRRQIPAAFAVARLGFSQVSSLRAFIRNRRRDFHRFPWGNGGAMEAAPPEADPLLGRLCFLSVIDGVAPYQNLISDETRMDQSCLSRLSTVYRMAPGSRSRSVRFRLTIWLPGSLIHSDWLSPLTMDIF